MLIMEINAAIKNIIMPCIIKSRINVNRSIVIKTKIDAHIIME
jgi:hypothetical protein